MKHVGTLVPKEKILCRKLSLCLIINIGFVPTQVGSALLRHKYKAIIDRRPVFDAGSLNTTTAHGKRPKTTQEFELQE